MALSGNLEDLPFTDVIQLLHVAKKSGTLRLHARTGDNAAIICRDGFIVGALHPREEVDLGNILVESGDLTAEQLADATRIGEQTEGGMRPLLAVLTELNLITKEQGTLAQSRLIHRTMAELIAWEEGTFTFDVSQIEGDDEFRHLPAEIEAWGGVDTQGALVEALRIFDERNREQHEREQEREEQPSEPRKPEDTIAQLSEPAPYPSDLTEPPSTPPPPREEGLLAAVKVSEDAQFKRSLRPQRAILLCTDGYLKHTIKKLIKDRKIYSYISGVEKDIEREIADSTEAGAAMVLVADLASGNTPELGPKRRVAIVRRIKTRRPDIPLVILSQNVGVRAYEQAFELGARTILPKPSEKGNKKAEYVRLMKNFISVLSACLSSIYTEQYELQERTYRTRTQMESLKKRVQAIQDRKSSPDISLIVLQYVAEYMDRGIIFLTRKTDLLGLGSFGMDNKGDTISAAAMRLKIPLNEPSIFADVVSRGIPFQGETDDPLLHRLLFGAIGRPTSNEILLLPLKTENKTRALIYSDFGKREASPVETDALEILASQAGMAMEVALQRTKPTAINPQQKAG